MKKSLFILALLAAFTACKKEDPTPTPEPTPEPETTALPEEFAAFADLFDGAGVGAVANLHEDVLLFFSQDGSEYAWFEENEIKATYQVAGSDGPLAGMGFNSVGAASTLGQNSLALFDTDGDRYKLCGFDSENIEGSFMSTNVFSFGSAFDLEVFGEDNTCPFNSIGAARAWSSPGTDCFDAAISYNFINMFNGNGDALVMYVRNTGDFFDEMELDNWTAENNCGGPDGLLPFESISATCRYVLPNKIQEIYFNEDGTQFCYYTVSEGVFSEIYDLY